MPGRVEHATGTVAQGWARHPRHAGYCMLVHAIVRGRVVASGLADQPRADGAWGFALQLPMIDPGALHIMLGETDEYLAHPASDATPRRTRTVEDLIATPTRRPWVNGACLIDGAARGLRDETIIDLLCRDYLGRPAGPVLIKAGLARLRQEGDHDGTRRSFLQASEFRLRRLYADAAPGAIFSQAMVMAVAGEDFVSDAQRLAQLVTISAVPLLRLEGEAFVTECYRSILRKEPDRAGLSHYLQQLAAGLHKSAIIRHLASELEAISAGVEVIDLPDDD